MENNKPKTSDRINNLEKSVQALSQANLGMAQALENQRRVVVSLSEKLEAIFYLSENMKQITEKDVDDYITEQKTTELKREVEQAILNGQLKPAKAVGTNSFVVVKEMDKTSKEVTQPRAQIAIAFMPDEVKNDFTGKKVGDKIDKGNVIIELTEVYDIVEAK